MPVPDFNGDSKTWDWESLYPASMSVVPSLSDDEEEELYILPPLEDDVPEYEDEDL